MGVFFEHSVQPSMHICITIYNKKNSTVPIDPRHWSVERRRPGGGKEVCDFCGADLSMDVVYEASSTSRWASTVDCHVDNTERCCQIGRPVETELISDTLAARTVTANTQPSLQHMTSSHVRMLQARNTASMLSTTVSTQASIIR